MKDIFFEKRMWRRRGELKRHYDVVIVGGGSHGLATAYYLAKEHGIRIVPLTIRFGDEEFLDREELSTSEFWKRCDSSSMNRAKEERVVARSELQAGDVHEPMCGSRDAWSFFPRCSSS